jgi:hypothetical protein
MKTQRTGAAAILAMAHYRQTKDLPDGTSIRLVTTD